MIARRLIGGAALSLLVASCAGAAPVAGIDGADWAVRSFYDRNAWERGATCTSPRMRITGWRIVDQTPERTIVDVRYSYFDEHLSDGDGLLFRQCTGFGERQFTLVPGGMRGATVREMTGEQRRPTR